MIWSQPHQYAGAMQFFSHLLVVRYRHQTLVRQSALSASNLTLSEADSQTYHHIQNTEIWYIRLTPKALKWKNRYKKGYIKSNKTQQLFHNKIEILSKLTFSYMFRSILLFARHAFQYMQTPLLYSHIIQATVCLLLLRGVHYYFLWSIHSRCLFASDVDLDGQVERETKPRIARHDRCIPWDWIALHYKQTHVKL